MAAFTVLEDLTPGFLSHSSSNLIFNLPAILSIL